MTCPYMCSARFRLIIRQWRIAVGYAQVVEYNPMHAHKEYLILDIPDMCMFYIADQHSSESVVNALQLLDPE